MIDILAIGTSGIHTKQNKIDTIAHNIANVNTIGYKKQEIVFADIYNQSLNCALNSTHTDYNQGPLQETDSNLDFAILGEGFFQVADSDGNIYYTRDGSFTVNQEGYLVNSLGYRLIINMDQGNAEEPYLQFPEHFSEVKLREDGTLQIRDINDELNEYEIQLAKIPVPSDALEPIGDNLYQYHDYYNVLEVGKPGENGLGLIQQNRLESSNVNLAEQFAQLVNAQRSFSLNGRVITSVDELWAMANNLKK